VPSVRLSVRKEDRGTLAPEDKLKRSKSAREGRKDRFSFFRANEATGSEFCTVYGLRMIIDALSTVLRYFDMVDVFRIVPSEMITFLEDHLGIIFDLQTNLAVEREKIFLKDADLAAAAEVVPVEGCIQDVTTAMELLSIDTIDLTLHFKVVEEQEVWMPNRY